MAKSIELTRKQWCVLREQIKKDYPPSVILLREKMKQKLGFVERTHRYEVEVPGKHGPRTQLRTVTMLDFYSEKKRTWFLMKYSDLINQGD